MMNEENVKYNFNYKITKLFLNNNRLTILCLFLLILVGVFSVFTLKTTGFPNPEIKYAVIQTIYAGASSEAVLKDVTQPLESSIKDVDGVERYISTSANSYSTISITISDSANVDTVKSKLDSAIRNVNLPVGVDSPKIISPEISGPDFTYVIVNADSQKSYELYSQSRKAILSIPETSKVSEIIDYKPELVVKIDENKLRLSGLTTDQVKAQLNAVGETLPIASDVTLDGKSQTLITQLSGQSIDDVKNITFQTNVGSVKLSDVAEITVEYKFKNDQPTYFGYHAKNSDKGYSFSAITFTVKAIAGTDLSKYAASVHEKINNLTNENVSFYKTTDTINEDNKVKIIETYAQSDSNEEQVGEVVRGLVGGPIKDVDNFFKYAGWILGAVQLIFLVMIAFVSWRAAIVAAISIPLSLMFSTIFVLLSGHDLNTLVLFSLVLVLGLVVDPTLVVLEAIQRKKDAGMKGKDAALAAIKDVGNGLFLATVANMIVFLPFGVISGILGQIFSYIPLTILPALVGSYIVPLIFLAWIGGLILRQNKGKTSNEEENLWPIAKWLIRTNEKILHSSVWIRLGVIFLAILIPFSIAGYYFGTGTIKSVQFASSDDSLFLTLQGNFLPSVSQEDRNKYSNEIIEYISNQKNVKVVSQWSQSFYYFISLTDKKDRPNDKASKIADNLNTYLQEKYSKVFFDIQANPIQTGPAPAAYQIAIGVKTDDLAKLKTASVDVGNILKNVCLKNRIASIDENCDGGKKIVVKVDDGYTNKENPVVQILLDRNKLIANQLTSTSSVSGIVMAQIKQLFTADPLNFSADKKVGTVNYNGEEINIVLDKSNPDPKSLDDIRNLTIFSPITRQPIKLSDIATINEVTPKASITRVQGETVNSVQARLEKGSDDQGTAAIVTNAILDYYHNNDGEKSKALGLESSSIEQYSEGASASFMKSFKELFVALFLAIIMIYIVLALFFGSFSLPIVILFTVPLTFIGVFPALAAFVGGQFGFLEIIGIIILTGLVVNVAIFLIDAARQKIYHDGWDEKRAIAYASGLRLRPVLLTKFTAIASLLPLALFSEFYRSIAIVIMFGLLTSGFTSLFTTPILFIFFRSLSRKVRSGLRKIFHREHINS